jgi:CubicO group peptidase (beta-lactamase class C family)/predicted glycoside hydrolase/deacetylase ChbG (UPF0249 family)
MRLKSAFSTTIFLLLLLTARAQSSLPRSTPEAEGVSSENILRFFNAVSQSKHEFHSFMLLRHGKVVSEGWWNPYRADLKHTMYSVSKSWTSTAVGFAVSEKRLTVQDKVLSFFPEYAPAKVDEKLAALRVKDLLTMSAGYDPEPMGIVGDTNWVRNFLQYVPAKQPGSVFLYNSAATYMLSAIVQKVTGQKVIDYLQPRLFQPLGIQNPDWEVDPKGINVGGWGLRIKTEDMAKLGQLYLQKGQWQGKQILPAAWVEEATTAQIQQGLDRPQEERAQSDWMQGYGYQFWRCRHGAYRGDGAFGQYIVVFPEQDAVLAITSETGDMQGVLNLVWEHILPGFKADKLPANKASQKPLKDLLAKMAIAPPQKSAPSATEAMITGKTFTLAKNDKGLENLSVQFQADKAILKLREQGQDFSFNLGAGTWAMNETTRKGPYLVARAKANLTGLSPFKVAAAYRWQDEKTLVATLRYFESPHHETITLRFNGEELKMENEMSFAPAFKSQLRGEVISAKNPPRLILRGDDMGYSHSINLAFQQCYDAGMMSSIEVMAITPWFEEAAKMLAKMPKIDVGLHLQVTSEWDHLKVRPLTKCPSLTDPDGYFWPMSFPNKNYPGKSVSENKVLMTELETELRAQIELAKRKVPQISHLSAHMGFNHISPEATALMRKLAKEYQLDIELDEYLVIGVGYDGPSKTSAEKLQSFISRLNKLEPGRTYLFVDHPALNDAEMKAIQHVGYENVAEDRQGVTDIWTNERVRKIIQDKGIQLIGYKDLLKKPQNP